LQVIKFQQNDNKEDKIENRIGSLLDNKRLIINKDALENDFLSDPQENLNFKFFYQLMTIDSEPSNSTDIGFPKLEHDDRIDVVANAIRFLQKRVEIRKVYQDRLNLLNVKAMQGDLSAQVELGEIYKNGRGVEENYQEALKWYTQALNSYNAQSRRNREGEHDTEEKNNLNKILFNLGEIYRKGMGDTPDYDKALNFYHTLAYKNQDARGYYGLAKLYDNRLVEGENINGNQKILDLYTKAARNGHVKVQLNLARIYQNGEA
jgi:TPR repeat protein